MKHVFSILTGFAAVVIVVVISAVILKAFDLKGSHWLFFLGWISCRCFSSACGAFYSWADRLERRKEA